MKNRLINQTKTNLELSRVTRSKTSSVSSAFTIIELLVVIAIIAILAALIFVAYPAIVKSALQATMQSSLSTSYRAITSFQSMNDRLPTSISDCDSSTSTTAKDAGYSSNNATTLCIKPGSTFTYTYIYNNNSNPQTFTLYAISNDKTLVYKVSWSNSSPIASTAPKTCPNNFILVPGSSTYGTVDFCVMKYEAKIYGNDNGKVSYSATNLPNSRSGGTPYVNITQTNAMAQSQKTVDSQGKVMTGAHLITEGEWMTIAQNVLQQGQNWSGGAVGQGYIYSGHNDYNPSNALAADTNDSNGYAGTNNTSGNQKRTLTLSNGETIWDLAGNVDEWTSGQTTGNQPGISGAGWGRREWKDLATNGSLPINPSLSGTGISGASGWTSGNGIGNVDSSADDTVLRGFLRGGYWDSTSYSGVLSLYLGGTPDGWGEGIGFRVVVSAS